MESPSTKSASAFPVPANNHTLDNGTEPISCIRFLVSNAMAGSIIGKGGTTINQFQKQSGAKIQLSRNREYFPGTTERIVAINGAISAILRAFDLIITKIKNEVFCTASNDKKSIQSRLIVPHNACGAIIGRGGATIRKLMEESQANIKLSSPEPTFSSLHERLVTISGTYEQQSRAVMLIVGKICVDANYAQYASTAILYTGKDMLGRCHQDESFPNSPFMGFLRFGAGPYPFYGVKGVPVPFASNVHGYPVHMHVPVVSPSTSYMISVPDDRISAIVDNGGKTISDIQQRCNVQINVFDRGSILPDTTNRKVMITGSPECIYSAHQMLTQKIQQAYSEVEK